MDLKTKIRQLGERLPKKHGEWYKLHIFDNHYLILDTWNGEIYHYPNGATPSDTDNMYRVVYVFYDINGNGNNYSRVKNQMIAFWTAHLHLCGSAKNLSFTPTAPRLKH
jgi:hypothetical protein